MSTGKIWGNNSTNFRPGLASWNTPVFPVPSSNTATSTKSKISAPTTNETDKSNMPIVAKTRISSTRNNTNSSRRILLPPPVQSSDDSAASSSGENEDFIIDRNKIKRGLSASSTTSGSQSSPPAKQVSFAINKDNNNTKKNLSPPPLQESEVSTSSEAAALQQYHFLGESDSKNSPQLNHVQSSSSSSPPVRNTDVVAPSSSFSNNNNNNVPTSFSSLAQRKRSASGRSEIELHMQNTHVILTEDPSKKSSASPKNKNINNDLTKTQHDELRQLDQGAFDSSRSNSTGLSTQGDSGGINETALLLENNRNDTALSIRSITEHDNNNKDEENHNHNSSSSRRGRKGSFARLPSPGSSTRQRVASPLPELHEDDNEEEDNNDKKEEKNIEDMVSTLFPTHNTKRTNSATKDVALLKMKTNTDHSTLAMFAPSGNTNNSNDDFNPQISASSYSNSIRGSSMSGKLFHEFDEHSNTTATNTDAEDAIIPGPRADKNKLGGNSTQHQNSQDPATTTKKSAIMVKKDPKRFVPATVIVEKTGKMRDGNHNDDRHVVVEAPRKNQNEDSFFSHPKELLTAANNSSRDSSTNLQNKKNQAKMERQANSSAPSTKDLLMLQRPLRQRQSEDNDKSATVENLLLQPITNIKRAKVQIRDSDSDSDGDERIVRNENRLRPPSTQELLQKNSSPSSSTSVKKQIQLMKSVFDADDDGDAARESNDKNIFNASTSSTTVPLKLSRKETSSPSQFLATSSNSQTNNNNNNNNVNTSMEILPPSRFSTYQNHHHEDPTEVNEKYRQNILSSPSKLTSRNDDFIVSSPRRSTCTTSTSGWLNAVLACNEAMMTMQTLSPNQSRRVQTASEQARKLLSFSPTSAPPQVIFRRGGDGNEGQVEEDEETARIHEMFPQKVNEVEEEEQQQQQQKETPLPPRRPPAVPLLDEQEDDDDKEINQDQNVNRRLLPQVNHQVPAELLFSREESIIMNESNYTDMSMTNNNNNNNNNSNIKKKKKIRKPNYSPIKKLRDQHQPQQVVSSSPKTPHKQQLVRPTPHREEAVEVYQVADEFKKEEEDEVDANDPDDMTRSPAEKQAMRAAGVLADAVTQLVSERQRQQLEKTNHPSFTFFKVVQECFMREVLDARREVSDEYLAWFHALLPSAQVVSQETAIRVLLIQEEEQKCRDTLRKIWKNVHACSMWTSSYGPATVGNVRMSEADDTTTAIVNAHSKQINHYDPSIITSTISPTRNRQPNKPVIALLTRNNSVANSKQSQKINNNNNNSLQLQNSSIVQNRSGGDEEQFVFPSSGAICVDWFDDIFDKGWNKKWGKDLDQALDKMMTSAILQDMITQECKNEFKQMASASAAGSLIMSSNNNGGGVRSRSETPMSQSRRHSSGVEDNNDRQQNFVRARSPMLRLDYHYYDEGSTMNEIGKGRGGVGKQTSRDFFATPKKYVTHQNDKKSSGSNQQSIVVAAQKRTFVASSRNHSLSLQSNHANNNNNSNDIITNSNLKQDAQAIISRTPRTPKEPHKASNSSPNNQNTNAVSDFAAMIQPSPLKFDPMLLVSTNDSASPLHDRRRGSGNVPAAASTKQPETDDAASIMQKILDQRNQEQEERKLKMQQEQMHETPVRQYQSRQNDPQDNININQSNAPSPGTDTKTFSLGTVSPGGAEEEKSSENDDEVSEVEEM